MKKILMVLTNIEKYKTINRPTGLWLGEAAHFYDEIVNAGYKVDFVSPKGGYVPIDPHSFKFASEIDWKWYHDEYFKNNALSNTLNPYEVNPENYIAIYYTGGHGVIWDFPNNEDIQRIAESIYENDGYITSVCHGAVGLLNLRDKNGEYLIKDRNITGFTNEEERLNFTYSKVPYSTENELKKRGANYMKKFPFKEFAITDGRFITGQNPQSPRLVAKLLINELKK